MNADSTQKPISVILDEIEERAKRATEGPWTNQTNYRCPGELKGCHLMAQIGRLADVFSQGNIQSQEQSENNGNFIASARTDVPALVKALRRAIGTLQDATECNPLCGQIAVNDITAILNQGRKD